MTATWRRSISAVRRHNGQPRIINFPAPLASAGGVFFAAGQSLRVGMAQDLTAAGFELSGIMQAGRWKSPEMPAKYSARLSAKNGAVAGYYAE